MFYNLPSSKILSSGSATGAGDKIFKGDGIAAALTAYGLGCKFICADVAPQVITYHFDLSDPMQRNSVKRYIKPVSAMLRCKVAEVDSNKNAHFALEVTRQERQLVPFSDVLRNKEYNDVQNPLSACLGYDTASKPVILDITKAPHILIAGETGGGKSVCLNTLLNSLLFRATPNRLRLLMVDTKRVELSAYEGLPHLLAPIAKDGQQALQVVKNLNTLMRSRYEKLNAEAVSNIEQLPPDKALPHICLIIDELADLMLMCKDEAEPLLVSIAQLGRAAGIHLILATQRPTVNVVTGLLKANLPCRIALQTASIRDSMTILDHKGAERLTGRGDAWLKTPDKVEERRIQIAFIDREDINAVCGWWRNNGITE